MAKTGKINRLSVTGHRPDKLFGGYSEEGFDILVKFAEKQLTKLSPEVVLSGLALGWDQAICQACLNQRIDYIACLPFADQSKVWPPASRDYWEELVDRAKEKVIVCKGEYASFKMIERNKYMVDNSDKLLALYNGTTGGTYTCVKYAKSVNREVINCWAAYAKLTGLKNSVEDSQSEDNKEYTF